jgi:hypothetical protein
VIGSDGMAGDEHADPRAHGGPEKAVHLFPLEHYEALARAFPEARNLHPGGLGENLSTRGLTEVDRHISATFLRWARPGYRSRSRAPPAGKSMPAAASRASRPMSPNTASPAGISAC